MMRGISRVLRENPEWLSAFEMTEENTGKTEAVFNKKQKSGLSIESMMQHIILQGWMKL